MKVSILLLSFNDITFEPRDIPKLRGWFTHRFPEYLELHNHKPDGTYSYKLPVIQYRIIDGHPALLAFGSGIEIVKNLFFASYDITIHHTTYTNTDKTIHLQEYELGTADHFINYQFVSPWMALNEENHKKWQLESEYGGQLFLRHLLRENLKTISKGFSYFIPDIEQIQVDGLFRPVKVNFKNQEMICFKGDFYTNFHIPSFLGLGKQSARGFGVVKECTDA